MISKTHKATTAGITYFKMSLPTLWFSGSSGIYINHTSRGAASSGMKIAFSISSTLQLIVYPLHSRGKPVLEWVGLLVATLAVSYTRPYE